MALELTPEKTRIGWIGTGVMGSSMCGHLMKAGYRESPMNNRTVAKAQLLWSTRAPLRRLPACRRRGVRRRFRDRRLPYPEMCAE